MKRNNISADECRQPKKIIGISGMAGSGKSFFAEYISQQTGIKLVKLDYQAAQTANKFILKQLLQKRIKTKIPKAYEDIQLFPLLRNLEKSFSKLEISLFKRILNRKVKKIIRKTNESLIIDFITLPLLDIVKKFDEMYLIKSCDKERLAKLELRDNMTTQQSIRADGFLEPYYAYNDAFAFSDIIDNDYVTIPEKVKEIVCRLKD